MKSLLDTLTTFAYYYPLFMSYLWMVGAVYYRYHWERADKDQDPMSPPELEEYPPVSILVPCHNEGYVAEETITNLLNQNYPNFEVIAINDGSRDNTAEILNRLEAQQQSLKVIHLKENKGKGIALNMGAMLSKNEYLVCIDGDALLEPNAVRWLVKHLTDSSSRVAAVTGNPRIRNRSSLLGKIQVGEFSSIIGLIKRSQRIYGRIFTVSGVVAAFRKSALQNIGFWSTDMVTEDIDISWRLQLNHWSIRFEPNALCWILMPETLSGLWRQRLRWAQGGMEVFLRHLPKSLHWKKRRIWPVIIEYIISVFWSFSVFIIIIFSLLSLVINFPPGYEFFTILPGWGGVVLGITCLIQFTVSLFLDSKYEKGLGKYYYWIIWYPLVYWMINTFTTVCGVPKAIMKKRNKNATWISPDRGVHKL